MSNKLPLHEWCIIVLFCFILLSLGAIAMLRQKPVMAAALPSENITEVPVLLIRVEGQVAKPGLHRLPLTAKLKQLLDEVQPLPTADLSQLNYRKRLRDGQTVIIPERKKITIQISGAVQSPGNLEILSGTRCCELADQIQALPDADLKAMKRKRRYIQDGDLVEVPFQKKKSKKKK